tara:strand:- start:5338 stop:6258 length:921 start_codon:yes stop_codon:yes gene_type:complete
MIQRPAIITLKAADIELNSQSRGTSLSLGASKTVDYFLIKGTVTLTSSLTISFDTRLVSAGTRLILEYHANVTLNSQTLTIAGKSIPARQANKPMTIVVLFDGTNTVVNLLSSVEDNQETISNTNIVANSITAAELATGAVAADEIASSAVSTAKLAAVSVTSAKLATDSVTTAKIVNANVTVEKLENEALESSMFIPVHFDYSSKDTFYFAMPTKCLINTLVATVSGVAVGATHPATMTIANVTAGTTLLSTGTLAAAAAAEGSETLVSLSNTTIAKRAVLSFTPDGSQGTGKLFITIGVRRLAD